MPQTQDNKRTKIKTVLDDNPQFKRPGADPLLLTMVQGSEAISAPYYMDVVMYAERRLEIDPKLMINTPATVSIRVEDRAGTRQPEVFDFTYQQRKGVFQTFIKQDRFHRRIGADFNVYAGRIVPKFQIMDQEVRYRIFEANQSSGSRDMTFVDILKVCTDNFKPMDLRTNYFDLAKVNVAGLPKMEHCVQYGESTFNFLSRLMARYSIWYYFDHDRNSAHEKMILGTGHAPKNDQRFPPCTLFKNWPDRRDVENNVLVDDWQFVTGMSRLYTPAPRRVRTGDFNTVISTQPEQSEDNEKTFVGTDFDIIQPTEANPETNYIQESFPDSTIYTDEDATGDANTALEIAEGQVFTITAVSRNPTFVAGKRFEYEGGSEDNVTTKQHLLTRMAFNAFDRDYTFVLAASRKSWFGLAAVLDDLLVQPAASFVAQFGSGKPPDLATAMAAAGLQEAINNSYENAVSNAHATVAQKARADKLPPTPDFGTYFAAGMAGYISAFLPNTTSILQDLLPAFQGAVVLIGRTVEVLIQTIALPATIISLIVGNNLARDIDDGTTTIINSIKGFLQHLLNVTDTDAYSACFVAAPLDKEAGIGISVPAGRNAQIFGPHLATVIGRDGIDIAPGEVWADKTGRVRVRFPWDRAPGGVRTGRLPPNKLTDGLAKNQYLEGANTVWLRVSEGWGGQRQFGSQFLPRVGDEVIVSFIDGDPDRPIITGRVYNSFNNDANLPLPNEEDKTKKIENMNSLRKLEGSYKWSETGIRTRILKQDGQNRKYHLLRFDDDPDHKQYLMRSQGRMDVTVMESYFNSTYENYNLTIGGQDPKTKKVAGDQMIKIYKNNYLSVGKDDDADLPGSIYAKVSQDYQLSVGTGWMGGNMFFDIKGNWSTNVGGQMTVNVLGLVGTLVLNASMNITLMVGPNSIQINPAGIFLTAPTINFIGTVYGAPTIGPPAPAAPVVPLAPIMEPVKDPTAADPGNIPKSSGNK
jgi:uncharacterized protein involved in type VI secretion and phage assembly